MFNQYLEINERILKFKKKIIFEVIIFVRMFTGFINFLVGRFMVLEYCENGQLKEYLKANKHRVNDEMHEKLYRFACGICKGMNYLASQGVISPFI